MKKRLQSAGYYAKEPVRWAQIRHGTFIRKKACTPVDSHHAGKIVTRDASKVPWAFRKDDFQMGIQQRLLGGGGIISAEP